MHDILKENDSIVVQLKGAIDENFDLPALASEASETIVFDFEAVEGINSTGIRAWVKFLETIEHKKVIFKNCRKIIMNQVNTVKFFLPDNAIVESLHLPYFCEECNQRHSVCAITSEVLVDGKVIVPDQNCPKCGEELEFDAIEKKYFKFAVKG